MCVKRVGESGREEVRRGRDGERGGKSMGREEKGGHRKGAKERELLDCVVVRRSDCIWCGGITGKDGVKDLPLG